MKLGYICAIIAAISVVHVSSLLTARELEKDLFTNYSTNLRPKIHFEEPVVVRLRFELTHIIHLEEQNQLLTTAGFFVARWEDDFLVWNPDDYDNIKSLVISPQSIWLPDFGLENSADSFYHDTFLRHFRVRVYHNGTVQWSFGGELSTLCHLDMTLFPFDVQVCEINLVNWAYNGNEVVLLNSDDHVETQALQQNGIWEVVASKVERHSHFYASTGNIPFPEVEFKIFLERKSLFYTMNLVLPCFFTIVVALGVFWVPPSSGEKISLGITVLLAFSVFQLVLQDLTPPNSDFIPIMGRLVIVVMGLSSVSVLTSIVVLYFHFRDCHHRVPQWLRVVAFQGLGTMLCLRKYMPKQTKDSNGSAKPQEKNRVEHIENCEEEKFPQSPKLEKLKCFSEWSVLDQIARDLSFMTARLRAKEKDEEIHAEWAALAKVIDRLMFWICIVVMVVMTGLFLQYHNHTHDGEGHKVLHSPGNGQ